LEFESGRGGVRAPKSGGQRRLINGSLDHHGKALKIKEKSNMSSYLSWIEGSPPKRNVGGSNPPGDSSEQGKIANLPLFSSKKTEIRLDAI
jgi:hypothetical protein